jgi:hypothetical protein
LNKIEKLRKRVNEYEVDELNRHNKIEILPCGGGKEAAKGERRSEAAEEKLAVAAKGERSLQRWQKRFFTLLNDEVKILLIDGMIFHFGDIPHLLKRENENE